MRLYTHTHTISLKKEKGITLIALVITIIVLLILAGVTIAALSGDNGILQRATEAKNKTEEEQEKESLELAVTSSQMENVNTLEINKERLQGAIRQQFGNNKDFSVTDNKDGSFLVNMNDTKRMYYIDETGEVINQSKMLKISTADELKTFRDDVNSGNTYEGWYVYLTNDITLNSSEEWKPIGYYPNENNVESETNTPFKGVFNGKGYEVNGININTTDKVQALFGLAWSAKIMNVGTGIDCNITGGISSAGLVGYAIDSNIYGCYNKANITCNNNGLIGGIVGQTKGTTVKNCYNIGMVEGGFHVGGIVGVSYDNSIVEECYNTGNVSGTSVIEGSNATRVGGICGTNANGIVKNVYNRGEISSAKHHSGGIIGINQEGVLMNAYNVGEIVDSGYTLGNIVGYNYMDTSKIKNSYGLNGKAANLIGINDGEVDNNCTEKNEEEMKNCASMLGEHFKNDYKDDKMVNDGYPILEWQ